MKYPSSPSPSSHIQLKNPLLCLLQKCRNIAQILEIHCQLITRNLFSDTFAVSRLIVAATCNVSTMDYAELVFSQIQQPPHTFIWNSMIRGYVESDEPRKAFWFYSKMQRDAVDVDRYTYPFVLKACGFMLGLREGRQVHGEIVKRVKFQLDVFAMNALISMYSKCGDIISAKRLFDGFTHRDLVSWNTMLAGYILCDNMDDAQKLFDEMPHRDLFSSTMMIHAYGKRSCYLSRARQLFNNLQTRDQVLWNSMLSGYAHNGDMAGARDLFDEMAVKNVISWSIMINGYARHGDPKEALKLFRQMLSQGIRADKVSVVGATQACGQLGALDQGRWIHVYMEKKKITSDIVVHTALLDMYMKCGGLKEARNLFDNMLQKNFVSWNVMIVGLGVNGLGKEALELFYRMEEQSILIDGLTLLGVLSACNHAGLVEEGLQIFEKMKERYGIEPKVEHYSCLVDLLCRAGRIGEAKNVLESMPVKPDPVLWSSLLAACQANGNLDIAQISLNRLVELKADDCGVYVLMSNIFAEKGMWRDVSKVRRLMTDRGMIKETGTSIVEVDGGCS